MQRVSEDKETRGREVSFHRRRRALGTRGKRGLILIKCQARAPTFRARPARARRGWRRERRIVLSFFFLDEGEGGGEEGLARDSAARYMSFFRVTNDALRAKREKDQPRCTREERRTRECSPEREGNAGVCPAHIFTAMNAQ